MKFRLFWIQNKHIITTGLILLGIGLLAFYGVHSDYVKEKRITPNVYAGQAFGTAIKKTFYDEDKEKCDELDDEIDQFLENFESQISVRIPDSEVSLCNKNYVVDGVYPLAENLVDYLQREMDLYKETKGAFSPCIRPLTALWGIEDGMEQVPSKEDINSVLAYLNPEKIQVKKDGVLFKESNMAIDFGAVGKGIACDEIKKILEAGNIPGAVVSIGGSIVTYGSKGDNRDWHIGIQDPRAQDGEVFGVLDVPGDTFISTSGDYEKYVEIEDVRYHHIMDPKTGYPADNGLISVTIVSDNGFLSDGLSTACFVMGLKKGVKYAEKKDIGAIFVTSDKEVYVTKSLKNKFRIQGEEYHIIKTVE